MDQVCEFLSRYYVRLNQPINGWTDYHRTGIELAEITSWLLGRGRRSFCKAVKDTAQQKLALSQRIRLGEFFTGCSEGYIGFAASNRLVAKQYRDCGRLGQKRSRKIGLVTDWRPVG